MFCSCSKISRWSYFGFLCLKCTNVPKSLRRSMSLTKISHRNIFLHNQLKKNLCFTLLHNQLTKSPSSKTFSYFDQNNRCIFFVLKLKKNYKSYYTALFTCDITISHEIFQKPLLVRKNARDKLCTFDAYIWLLMKTPPLLESTPQNDHGIRIP